MKLIILLVCLALAFAEDQYDSSNDNFNLEEVLENDRLLHSYANCLLDKGPCTPEVKRLKEKLPEALETNCAKCTDRQKELGKKVAYELKERHPKIWEELGTHYDPQGKYKQAFQEFLGA